MTEPEQTAASNDRPGPTAPSSAVEPPRLGERPIHLGLGGTAIAQPPFTGMDWYAGYDERHGGDGVDGRLVSMYTFDAPWEMWEVHPQGSEVVLCVAGEVTLHQEHADGTTDSVTLGGGDYAINPPGTWHTADVDGTATCVFVTAGKGTEHRPR